MRMFAALSAFATIGWGSGADGQRLRFPTPATTNVAGPTTSATTAAPSLPPTSAAPAYNASPYGAGGYGTSPYGSGATPIPTPSPSPSVSPYTSSPYASSPYAASPGGVSPYGSPSYNSAPILGPGSVPVTEGSVLGPTASPTISGGVQLPPPQWDPYAPPGTVQSPALLPQDPYLPGSPSEAIVKMRRLMQELRIDHSFISATGDKKFGINDLDGSVTFAFPFLYNQDSPLLVTPGFAVHWWQNGYPEPEYALPPRVYDAYLSTGWNPQITPWLGGELEFCISVNSDFKKVTQEALHYTGRGLFVLNFSEAMKIKAGIIYYDRVKIKLLPAGGLIWSPNPDTRFDIFFPEPRFAWRLTSVGNTEWWYYIRGEYGGGTWALTWTGLPGEPLYETDYNDIRVAMGLEFARLNVLDGHIEFGVSTAREIYPNGPIPVYKPSTTFFLGAGLAY